MEYVVDRLIDFSSGKDDELRDISSLGMHTLALYYLQLTSLTALKTITSELPPEGRIASKACEKLAPKLLAQLSKVRYNQVTRARYAPPTIVAP